MPLFDLPLEQLRGYTSGVTPPADLQDFWDGTIRRPGRTRWTHVRAGGQPPDRDRHLRRHVCRFRRFPGERLAAPAGEPAGGSRCPSSCSTSAIPAGAGCPTRTRSGRRPATRTSSWTPGARDTAGSWGTPPDPHPSAGDVAYAGLMTRGVGSREDYYYRRVYVDAFRAVEAAQSHPAVDARAWWWPESARAAASPLRWPGSWPEGSTASSPRCRMCPSCRTFPASIDIAPRGPYPEIAAFLARHRDRYEAILAVLNYFDGVNLARAATAPALFSVAQMDDICPPSTVFASFNAYGTGAAGFGGNRGRQGHRGVPVQQPRGRPGTPVEPPAAVPAQAARLTAVPHI